MKYTMIIICFLFGLQLNAQNRTNPSTQSVELGKVSWYRNYEEAINASEKTNKPILILFQEIPGCATCKNYGKDVLTHPLLVEAIEGLFIPLAIYNNKKGNDAKILKKFGEPSWNNPVLRIINNKEENLIRRINGNYSIKGIYDIMETVLIKEKIVIPKYFELLGDEIYAQNNPAIKVKYYQMFCFWSGEGHLGNHEAVLLTEAGFMQGHEVVKVLYNSNQVSEKELDLYAKKANCSSIKGSKNYRLDKDQQYYLKQTNYKYLPLTKTQRTKINSALAKHVSPTVYLSPKQLTWLTEFEKNQKKKVILYTKNFKEAWRNLE